MIIIYAVQCFFEDILVIDNASGCGRTALDGALESRSGRVVFAIVWILWLSRL